MTVQDIIREVDSGNVVAPLGTNTFCVFWVTPKGELVMAGSADPSNAVHIAYTLMKLAFEPSQRKKTEDVNLTETKTEKSHAD